MDKIKHKDQLINSIYKTNSSKLEMAERLKEFKIALQKSKWENDSKIVDKQIPMIWDHCKA